MLPDPSHAWFPRAGLGLFVHWGIASVAGVDLSWGGMKNRPWCPSNSDYVDNYYALAEQFRPHLYDPEAWLAAARAAGMEYAILGAKHHDGYTLWPSAYGDFGVHRFLDGRDLVAPFIQAARRQGLKVGLYFSLPDWKHPDIPTPLEYQTWADFSARKSTNDPADLLRFERFFNHVKGQIGELVTRYGRLDILWFDGNLWNPSLDGRFAEIERLVRHRQPGVIIGRGPYGDYLTLEPYGQDLLPAAPPEGPWEICQSWHTCGGWGYYREETLHPAAWVIARLARTRGWGGNYLLNIGPRPDGQLPESAYLGLDQIARWMAVNAPAVKDVLPGPWPDRCPVPITRRRGVWYVHVLSEHGGPVVLERTPRPEQVRLLRDGSTPPWRHNGRDLVLDLPDEARRSPDEVVALSWPPALEAAMGR